MKPPELLTLEDLRRMIEPLAPESKEATARAVFEICHKANEKRRSQ